HRTHCDPQPRFGHVRSGRRRLMGDTGGQTSKSSFWATLPGLITAIATLVGATGGLIGGLYASGIIGPQGTASPSPAAATIPTVTRVNLPGPNLIYNQPVDDAVRRLVTAGLVVRQADIGCSNSTEPGHVRQVTVGPIKNAHI